MKRNPLTLVIGLLLIVIFGLLLFVFQVRTTEVAVVTTFGKPTRPITEPDLYFKWPWPIQKVWTFDQRVQNFEDKLTEGLTADNFNLLTSVYVGWQVSPTRRRSSRSSPAAQSDRRRRKRCWTNGGQRQERRSSASIRCPTSSRPNDNGRKLRGHRERDHGGHPVAAADQQLAASDRVPRHQAARLPRKRHASRCSTA